MAPITPRKPAAMPLVTPPKPPSARHPPISPDSVLVDVTQAAAAPRAPSPPPPPPPPPPVAPVAPVAPATVDAAPEVARLGAAFSCSSPECCALSPDGRHVALAEGHRLCVRLARDDGPGRRAGLVVTRRSCAAPVARVAWSADGARVLCALPAAHCAQLFSLEDARWLCRVREADACGLSWASWLDPPRAPPRAPRAPCTGFGV